MRELDGRAALVTGASQGLGREIAAAYVRAGANVVICARDAALIAEVAAELQRECTGSQRVVGRACDVSQPEAVTALVRDATHEFPHLDILVNSAGVYGPKGRIEDNDWSEWVQAIEIDLFGAVLLCRAIVPHLRKLGTGKIIQLSGGGATAPLPRLSAYATAKAAVVRFMESLALELADAHVDVNCIAPGALNTRMLDEILAAGPDAVGEAFYKCSLEQKQTGGAGLEKGAALALFLASGKSDGLTGRLISAVWDPWPSLDEKLNEIEGSDIYTLRRIVPKDRGQMWENS